MKAKDFMDYMEKYIREFELRDADVRMLHDGDEIFFEFNIKISDTESITYSPPSCIPCDDGTMDFDKFYSITHVINDPTNPDNPQFISILPEEACTIRENFKISKAKEKIAASMTDRDTNLFNDVNNGMTFAKASKKYGISPGRAAELYHRAERRQHLIDIEDDPTKEPFEKYMYRHLSFRTINALRRANIHSYQMFLIMTDDEFLKIRGIGELSLVQIREMRAAIIKAFKL